MRELHRHGNERAWWANVQVPPLPVASELWAASPIHETANVGTLDGAHTLNSGKAVAP